MKDLVHSHHHSNKHIKAISNRLSRTIGHLESVKRMVEMDKDCSEILIQLAAIKGEVNNTAKAILKEHLAHCMIHFVLEKDEQGIEDLNKAIDMFMK
ncbi:MULTISPECIES: metal-sensing transcriptional repressor [unclassified Campylobacter]|uniref:metal-sensing transcriptional repressor n=1 Tax=unclassified Campylobacter TaxID=2593542 RepID=UPI001237A801|nr:MULTISPECIES: metal-sensing transcriptional repressor [unclassified Campylobacter]KAA6225507.1 metal-sensing transcriptional repressor [Campylobacter sp. LR196d]KAA6226944.1 metal-sensing transcriptional repressor [Campylobacter sp. LR185c]KAA6229778.1 metal-sensing transcriptional repressor [Campylobacter sp. LR286c]KAA6234303.1 metal-sensing transcriptional repressor [Campylobacter sp. LR291e]KAA6234522.1 metal-sensing transcriptional repressor [Campylobacter sp. LR264d]